MPFDGTPGPGRPKGSRSGASRAKEWAEKDGGWELIIRMVKGIEPNFTRAAHVRATLAVFLIERAYGKASQSIELSGPNGGPVDVRSLLLDLCSNPQQLVDAQIQAAGELELKKSPQHKDTIPESDGELE